MSLWECKCGHIEEGLNSPDECIRCGRLDEFVEVIEEDVASDEDSAIDEMLSEKEIRRAGKHAYKKA